MTWVAASALVWMVWLAYWIAAARRAGPTRRQSEGAASRVLHFAMLGASLFLVYGPDAPGTAGCQWRSVGGAAAGLGLQVSGLLLTVVARVRLGRNWGGAVQLKEGHEIVQSGPYSAIRHPIYAGLLVAVAGSVLVSGHCQAVLAVPLCLVAYVRKLRMEERFLAQVFGQAYEDYRRRTGALVPTLRARRREDAPP
jgi:protein-S-isoprenylcysteine O-methyltransferase Ste14